MSHSPPTAPQAPSDDGSSPPRPPEPTTPDPDFEWALAQRPMYEREAGPNFRSPIVNALAGILAYRFPEPAARSQQLADALAFFVYTGDRARGAYGIWDCVTDMVACIPAEHAWRDILAEAFRLLRGRAGPAVGRGDSEWNVWTYLPDLGLVLADKDWAYMDTDADDGAEFEVSVGQYYNCSAFAARLSAAGWTSTWLYAIVPLRIVFEDGIELSDQARRADEERTEEELREVADLCERERRAEAWVATEWLLRCPRGLYETLTYDFSGSKEPTAQNLRAMQVGQLFKDSVEPYGRARWELWKDRAEEWAETGKDGEYEFDEESILRLRETVRCMRKADREVEAEREKERKKARRVSRGVRRAFSRMRF